MNTKYEGTYKKNEFDQQSLYIYREWETNTKNYEYQKTKYNSSQISI